LAANKDKSLAEITSVTRLGDEEVSVVVLQCAFFDIHVLEFTGLEDFTAFFAFHELRVLIAAYDLNAQMLTGLLLIYVLR
jgi:hypothetical protein